MYQVKNNIPQEQVQKAERALLLLSRIRSEYRKELLKVRAQYYDFDEDERYAFGEVLEERRRKLRKILDRIEIRWTNIYHSVYHYTV